MIHLDFKIKMKYLRYGTYKFNDYDVFTCIASEEGGKLWCKIRQDFMLSLFCRIDMSHAMANHENWARQRVLYMMAQTNAANWRIRITLHNESADKAHNTYVGVVQLCALPHQRELIRSTVNSTMDKCMPFTYM